jgi:hypothetical protein
MYNSINLLPQAEALLQSLSHCGNGCEMISVFDTVLEVPVENLTLASVCVLNWQKRVSRSERRES